MEKISFPDTVEFLVRSFDYKGYLSTNKRMC